MDKQHRGKRRIKKRFLVNLILFILIVALGLVFKDEYVAARTGLRDKVASTAERIVTSVRTGELRLGIEDLRNVVYGADSEPVSGEGVEVSESDAATPTNTGEEYAFPAELYPYRAMLNTEAQRIYNQVYAHAAAGNGSAFTLVQRTTEEALQTIMCAVYNDHPELFWVDTAYSFGYLATGDVITVTLSFNDTAKDLAACKKEFDAAVATVVQGAARYGNNVDKEKYVHDYLMDHCVYDESAPMHQSAYSALVRGKSVCAGYARAFQRILLEIGIPCYYATGTASGGSHAWNIVSVNGDCYNVDASWDDAAGTAYGSYNYTYFNVPDEAFSRDHTRDEMSAKLPACTATAMTYENVYGSTGGNAAQNAPSASARATYESLGYTASDVISSLSAYHIRCKNELIQRGTGTYTLTMVLRDAALLDAVYASAKSGDYVDGYAQEVADALALSGAEISLNLRAETLADGYVLLKQTVTLTGERRAARVTKAPVVTPTPSATPTATPTAAPTVFETPEPTQEPAPAVTPGPDTAEPPVDAPPETPDASTPENALGSAIEAPMEA